MQEALLAAARQWPDEGTPDNPRAWLIRVGVAPAGRRAAGAEPGAGPSARSRWPTSVEPGSVRAITTTRSR